MAGSQRRDDRPNAMNRDASGFRLRGEQVTRLETFVDAAVAFSLTLLVIFTNDLPNTAAELREALKKVPTFVACFAVLMMFWSAHNRWSRRFGLEDAHSTVLSLGFVLVVMVYVYPLRMVISSFLSLLSGGWLPNELGFGPHSMMRDLQTAFIVYSLGFGLLAWVLWRLNVHALRHADALRLAQRWSKYMAVTFAVGAVTGGVIVIAGASCAKAAGVDRTRNAAIALVAGRERAIFFIIVKDKRTALEKRCAEGWISTTSRGGRTARRRIRRDWSC